MHVNGSSVILKVTAVNTVIPIVVLALC